MYMASDKLQARGVVIVPDILANAGGVIASYFEWVQNSQRYSWDMDTVVTRMEQHLLRAYQDVFRRAGTEQVDMRTAAYEIAVRRVLHAVELRGF